MIAVPKLLEKTEYHRFFRPSHENLIFARKFVQRKTAFLGKELSEEIISVTGELLADAVYHGIGDDADADIGIFGTLTEGVITVGVIDPHKGESKLSLDRGDDDDEKHRGYPLIEGLGFKYSRSIEGGWTVARATRDLSRELKKCLQS